MLKNRKKNNEESMSTENQAQNEMKKDLGQDTKAGEQGEQKTAQETAEGPESENEKRDVSAEEAATTEPSQEEKLRTELSEANNKYLRLYAEFDNFKRRTSRERMDLLQTAGREVLQSLLPVLDDFERALKSLESSPDNESVKEGVKLVYNKFKTTLAQKGLKEMESIGTPFDAELHEAITNIPAPSEDMKGKVIDEVEKGYYLNDKVIRFAKVVVGN